ncbi:MAG: NgoBV family restriction endonuclease [Bacteroidia bacterium]
MIELTAQQLYDKIVNEYNLIGQKGIIRFTINNLTVEVESKDSVGNMIQEWLLAWMKKENILFEASKNSQQFPDVYLKPPDKKSGLLEIKAFNYEGNPGFDLANFDTYCNSLLEESYHLDCDYLVLGYTMSGHEIEISKIWLKKIWELSGGSKKWPIRVQDKRATIYNLRPTTWYSKSSKFKPFNSKEEFLHALNETRHQYYNTSTSLVSGTFSFTATGSSTMAVTNGSFANITF